MGRFTFNGHIYGRRLLVRPTHSRTHSPSTGMTSRYTLRCQDCSGLGLLRKEFQLRNLWASLGQSGHGRVNWIQGFGASRFEGVPQPLFVFWRFLVFAFAVGVTFASIALEEVDGDSFSFGYWMWYLTHWVIAIHALYATGLFASTLLSTFKFGLDSQAYKQQVMPRVVQFTWVLMSMSLTTGLFVTLLNWVLLRPINPTGMNFLQHGVVWGSIVLDYLFGKQPLLLLHGLWITVLGLCYGVWTVIHSSLDLPNKAGCFCVYDVINWDAKPAMAAFWAFGSPFVVILPMHLLFWSLNFCRVQAVDVDEHQVTVHDNDKA